MNQRYDLIIQHAQLVRPNQQGTETLDIGVKDGRIAALATGLPREEAVEVHDARGQLAFPGAIDAHTHVGIYQHPSVDAPTESAAAAAGGVTVMLNYVRTGSLYLNMGGSHRKFFPAMQQACEGHFHVDYGFQVSPIEHGQIAEMEYLATECGCPNFGEVFMFYGLHGLHGRSEEQSKWLMLNDGDHYDLAHFDFICREAARLQQKHPHLVPYLAVSFHCETPEILRAYEQKVRQEDVLKGLQAYSAARPPHSEAIAISIVGAMANAAGLTNANIMHITSREALDAALAARASYPKVNFGLETTAGHLLLDYNCAMGAYAKVNPPLRSPDDRDYLWQRIADGTLQWIITDHACCPLPMKASDTDDIWNAKAGFGGVEFLLAGIFSEAAKRGVSANRVAELTSYTPSRRFGLLTKGDLDIGFDADIALLDASERWTIRAQSSRSAQGYTPFEGIEVTGRVKTTFLSGRKIFDHGEVLGARLGRYLRRPG